MSASPMAVQPASTWNEGQMFGKKLTSEFHYVKYKVTGSGATYCQYVYWTVRGERWNGGALIGADVSGQDGLCNSTYVSNSVLYTKNTSFLRSSSAALKFGGAVSFFGFTAGAQSGFSAYVRTQLRFGSKANYYWICGNDGKPTVSHRVFAGPNSM
jgi:hypothetical protein